MKNFQRLLETSLISRISFRGKIILIIKTFRNTYKDMIVGELDRNYAQIRDMYEKLIREEKED